ncbi:MAG: LytR/AlgR family response regulator transcription factor [Mangrovibacterium sp.]
MKQDVRSIKVKYSCVIVDDEEKWIASLSKSLEDYPEIRILGTSRKSKEAIILIRKYRPDLLFLDVEMPGMDGLELLRELRVYITWAMQVVFYTLFEKYLLQALRESAFDFLLKPYNKSELQEVMDRFFKQKMQKPSTSFEETFSRLIPGVKTFKIETVSGFQILHLGQIGYFDFVKKEWLVYLSDQNYLRLKNKTTAEDILRYSDSFIQINQHQIINIHFLSMIVDNECILFPPFENKCNHKITRIYKDSLLEKFCSI